MSLRLVDGKWKKAISVQVLVRAGTKKWTSRMYYRVDEGYPCPKWNEWEIGCLAIRVPHNKGFEYVKLP